MFEMAILNGICSTSVRFPLVTLLQLRSSNTIETIRLAQFLEATDSVCIEKNYQTDKPIHVNAKAFQVRSQNLTVLIPISIVRPSVFVSIWIWNGNKVEILQQKR